MEFFTLDSLLDSVAVPRVALVHDFLLDLRGAERVFAAMCEQWPEADVFTAIYDERGTEGRFAKRDVRTSFLQKLRPTARTFRPLLPLYPHAVESLDLTGYDVVISSSSAWAHGVLLDPGTVHVCYCYNPFRYAWIEREATLAARHPLVRPFLRLLLNRWRQWDFIAAQRVDRYVACSNTTAARVRRYFGRESEVLHPPVEIARFSPGTPGEHYLILGELLAHKRVHVAVEAFTRLGLPLVVAGDGPELRRLKRMAGPTITFEGRVTDARAEELLRSCRALVVVAAEEFGIAAVEALASGRPVIALAQGGVLETVTEGVSGTFFANADAAQLAEAVRRFDTTKIDPAACVRAAQRFDTLRFQDALARIVDDAVEAETSRDRSLQRPSGLALQPRRFSRRNAPTRPSGV